MGIIHNNWHKTAVAIAISAALCSVANAENQKADEGTSGIERIEVTSQKRIQSIQEVGIALTAFPESSSPSKSSKSSLALSFSPDTRKNISGGLSLRISWM